MEGLIRSSSRTAWLDLRRHGVPHVAFGFGMHICFGFPLARLEGPIALRATLARSKRIELAVPEKHRMNRRDTVLALVFLGAARGPLRSVAQQPGKIWRIGLLAAVRQRADALVIGSNYDAIQHQVARPLLRSSGSKI